MLFLWEIFVKVSHFFLKKVLKSGGETWPGEIILRLDKKAPQRLAKIFEQIIFVVGTNGKTSTAKFLSELLSQSGYLVLHNPSGANQLNGIVTNILVQKKLFQNQKYFAVLEIDEYYFPVVAKYFKPHYVILLNALRDQLDRYGEVNNILNAWENCLLNLKNTTLILNSSDPGLFFLGKKLAFLRKINYSVPEIFLQKTSQVFGDTINCQLCQRSLVYDGVYVSHIGNWRCEHCQLASQSDVRLPQKILREFSYLANYFLVNLTAVYALAIDLKISEAVFSKTLSQYQPAFGRGECVSKDGNEYYLYLGKNPASWTVAMEEMIKKMQNTNLKRQNNKDSETVLVFGLNNRNPDGHDVSWIWDIGINLKFKSQNAKFEIYVFGDRVYDMAIRLKSEEIKIDKTYESLPMLVKDLKKEKYLAVFILANYSAMLEIRKQITGRAIL